MTENRRPLASRETHWARSLTRWLAATSITPNQISMVSMLMAALAGVAFYLAGGADGVLRVVMLILAALFCQLRLLCNLLDGMVAIEAGKSAADGPFWNEFPDRVSDILIVVGLGYGVGHSTLGWAAASFCVLTAYVRELGRASGAPADFSRPNGQAAPHGADYGRRIGILLRPALEWPGSRAGRSALGRRAGRSGYRPSPLRESRQIFARARAVNSIRSRPPLVRPLTFRA